MRALLPVMLLAALLLTVTGCSNRNNVASSSMPSSSVSSSIPPAPTPSPSPSPSLDPSTSSAADGSSHNSGVISDLGDAASDAASDLESAVTPTLSADFLEIGALDATPVRWGPGTIVNETTNRTTASDELQKVYGQYNTWFIAPEDTDKFYFTFDCGYENGYTATILDVLKDKNVKGVFFITGHYAQSAPDMVRRMIDEGHIVGNHSANHMDPTSHTLGEVVEDITKLHNYVKENYDYDMFLYRPPEGMFSQQTLSLTQQMGYTSVMWSFAYADWDPQNQMGPESALARTTRFIHPGAIYLLHTTGSDNPAILGDLIDAVRAKGLEPCLFDLYPKTGET